VCHHLQARKGTILVLLRPARVVAGRLVLVGVVVVVESLAGMGVVMVVAADLLLCWVVLPVLLGVVLLGLVEAGVVELAVIQHHSDREPT
jgi:hypothetical protein